MKNSDYWKKRFEILEQSAVSKGASYYSSLEQEYKYASKNIESEIATWYTRFADNNNISLADARKLLNSSELAEFKWTVEDYIKYGEENALNQQWMKQLENASAKVHISRLESLKLQMQQQMEVLYGNQTDGIDNLARKIYSDGYYHTAFEIQKGFNVGWDLQGLNEKQLSRVLNKPWTADNQTFRDKCWKQKNELVSTVSTELTQAIMRGDSPDKAIKTISEKFNVAKSKAGRLVMTESAYFASEAQKDCFNELNVDKFEIVATLDSHTSQICQGLDGQVFDMKDYQAGVTAPPFHPWCRSTTVPYFEDNFGERAARDSDGNTYYVSSDMKYADWKKTFVNGGSKADLKKVDASDIIKVTDIKAVKDALVQCVGFDDVESSFNVIDEEVQIANTNQLLKLEEKFGCVHDSSGTICAVSDGNSTVAYVRSRLVNPTSQNLSLCPKFYKSKAKLIESEKEAIVQGWSMPANLTDEEIMIYTVTHEYGHILQNTLIRKEFEKAGWVATDEFAFVNYARKTKKAMFKWYYDLNAKVKNDCFTEIIEIAKEANENFKLADNISAYGKSNKAEFFAEVFANSQLSKPNELGKAMNVWLERKGLILK